MSIYNELKRRNVIKVAIAYAVIAWVLMQVAATTFPALKLPDWTVTLVAVLLLIGFPVALIFAWAFELTPEGIKLEKDIVRSESITHTTGRKLDFIIIGVLAVALVLFAVERFILLPDTAPASDSAQEVIATEVQQSIAVLAFVNMSDDPGNEYFSDGMSEEILNLLARIPGLKVIGRTSSFAFKGKNEDLRVIGQKLDVKTVLEGSVRKSGDRVRITAQLVDVSDGAHIWSETYDRTMNDIFAVQDDVAAAIIDALQIHVSVNPTRGSPTESPEAYALFLKARVLLNAHNNREASQLLRQVTELDPDFAEAHELLAASYWSQAGDNIDVTEGFMLSGEAATKALAINPDLAFAQALYYIAMGGARSHLNGIEALARAWREQPGNSAPLRPLIYELTYAGYHREAHRLAKQYATVDPLSPVANYSLGETLYMIGQTSEAMAPLTVAYDLENEFASWFVPYVHLIEGRDEIAIPQFEADLELNGISDTAWVRELVTGARDPAAGLAYLDQRIPQIVASMPDEHAYYGQNTLLNLYLLFGFLDRYYEIIFAAGPNDQSWTDADVLVWMGTVFRRDGFTSHPRYLEVAELLGITRIWEHRGPPDFCEKSEGQWVCE